MPFCRRGLGPVVDGDGGLAGVEAFEVFLKPWQAFFVGVGADQPLGGTERGGDEEGLAAGRGAGVENALAGLRIEQFDGVAGGGVLDVNGPGREQGTGQRAVDLIEARRVFDRRSRAGIPARGRAG